MDEAAPRGDLRNALDGPESGANGLTHGRLCADKIRSLMRKPTRDSVRTFWEQLLVAHAERLPDEFLDLSALSQARNAESWFALLDRTLDFRGLKTELVTAARFADLKMPVTLLWGDKDAFAAPVHGERLAARCPNLRLVRIADAGHAPWMDQPEATAKAILDATAPAG